MVQKAISNSPFSTRVLLGQKELPRVFEDMMGNLAISNGKISASQYFLGTMLFIGNFTEGTDQEIQVVDGQQRLTTITILFSALSDRFVELGETTLSRQIFTYIMTEDDDGKEVRILKSKTSYPFLRTSFKIKKRRSVKRPIVKKKLVLKRHMITLYLNSKMIN